MKKTKILSLLLCLSLLCALLVPGPAAHADDADSGMNISKTAKVNADGSYTITLEAFATGSKVTTVVKEDVPTDIILVLDQSGSMYDDIGTVAFEEYKDDRNYHTRNRDYYEYRHNGGGANLWHKLADGSYVSVSVELQQTLTYNKITNGRNNNSDSGYTNYWENRNNLYTYVNGEIKKVIYTRERDYLWENWNCKYALEDGTILNENSEGSRHSPTFQNTDDGYLYLSVLDENKNIYKYTYTDTSGVTQTIGTSTGADTVYTPAFYKKVTGGGGGSKLAALKSAATTFVNAVAAKAAGPDGNINTTEDNVNHRIAVVGFASQSDDGNNTELLSIDGWNSGSVGVAYDNITAQNLKDVVQRMDTSAGQTMVANAINALAAEGATRIDLGLDMANRILGANPVADGEKRNRVVIVFTDGAPTDWNGFQLGVADSAISYASAIKSGGATVYSVGIFSGADATSAGSRPANDYHDDGWNGNNYTGAQMAAACNWFMQNVSSNNGSVRSPSYYLSASDSGSLNSIFQQISSNIEFGGSSTTLDSSTVVKDIISPSFTLPDGATASSIQIDTYECTEKDGDTYTWATTSSGNGGATATVNGAQVSVTGFDFSANWCGIEKDAQGNGTVRGKKLVISFTVSPKPGFLGGNDVPTNTKAGIYKDGTAETPVMEFEQPTVNVPIQPVTVEAENKNVYLLGTVTADQLKSGATVTVGNVSLDLSQSDYDLESWQTEYVDITVTVKDANNNVIPTGLSNLTDDTTYTIEVTVSPKKTTPESTQGEKAETKSNSGEGKINVFKPTLTFKDTDVYYGDNAPTDYSGNLTGTQWKHGDTLSTDSSVTMIGTAPDLGLTYTPETGKIANGKINTKQDIAVDVAVKIGNTDATANTTFIHTKCSGNSSCTDPTNGKFWLHVKTCTLTVTKTGGATDESYVFDVYKDGTKYSEVTVWGNGTETLVELPVGTYTIQENTGWSWRYSPSYSDGATLSATSPTGTIICTNSSNGKNQWLNGFSSIVHNIFGKTN